jgi:hypothetical protein
MGKGRISPIRRPARRQAGQGLRERIATERDGFGYYAGGIVFAVVLLVAVVWVCWLLARPITPWVVTGLAVVIAAVVLSDLRRRARRGRDDALGLSGELDTAEWLGDLAAAGYRVFHDLQGPRGNIDHIAVGPAGVLVIETKTRSKSPGDRVCYDGRRLLVGRWDATDEYLGQARACRDDVRRRLREHSQVAASVPVRAVLAFPGWDVEEGRASGAEVWVLNPKRRIAAWAAQEVRREGAVSRAAIDSVAAMLDAWARG